MATLSPRLSAIPAFVCLILTASAQPYDNTLFSGLKWRNIGPFRGGRCLAVAGSQARPKEFYFGATGGGVWKTTDGGARWSNVSDNFFTTASVGAVAISASNPDVVYAGTGERDIRGNISHGDGMYKTVDAGKTWTHVGLEDSQNVSRIQIDPKNPDVVFVAALGHVYGPNQMRGIFKSTDGGKHWRQILFESEKAGAVDLAMDPADSQTLYATTWEAWRTPYILNSGGPGSKLYKTTDGGEHWTDLSRMPGMPKGVLGKIGVTVSPKNSKRLFASVEADDGGLFKSDDAGATWTLVNDSRDWRQRAWYYTHVYADPKDQDTLYVLNVGSAKSTNAGKTFQFFRTPHGDNHDLWIAPDDPKRMIESNDGGANVSFDGGQTWSTQEFATAQFYHVVADNAFPYHVLGAQQDNSTVRIASRSDRGGIGRTDWTGTAGGESGYIAPKPDDPDVVFGGSYGGELEMLDHRTNQSHDVNPWPDNPMGWAAKDIKERFQWTFPIVFSPHDSNELYTASQYVFRTTNGGQSWQQISPDLTRNDPHTMESSGGPITKDNTSVEYYGTVFTVAESPVRRGMIWTGSDDGLVQLTRNSGGKWEDVTPSNKPRWAKISIVEPSHFSEETAYLAVDNHTADDFSPYAYRTHDGGRSWTKIVTGVGPTAFVRSIREDPAKQGLLYLATESGVYISFNDGDQWQPLQLNLPVCPVHDLAIKDGDLIAATHGRSFWILDNLSPIRQLASIKSNPSAFLFQPIDPLRVAWGGGFGRGAGAPVGQNPPSGLILDYYLGLPAKLVRFEILSPQGSVLMSVDNENRATISTEKGMHRQSLRLTSPSYRSFPGMIFWAADPSPIPLPPGDYVVRMTADKLIQTRNFRLLRDPRSRSSDHDLREQYEFSTRIRDRVSEANDAVVVSRDLIKKIAESLTASKNDPDVTAAANPISETLRTVEAQINEDRIKSEEDPLNYPIKLNNKIAAVLSVVQSGAFRPTKQSYDVFSELSAQLQNQLDALGKVLKTQLPTYNSLLKSKGVAEIVPVDPTKSSPPATSPRRGEDDD